MQGHCLHLPGSTDKLYASCSSSCCMAQILKSMRILLFAKITFPTESDAMFWSTHKAYILSSFVFDFPHLKRVSTSMLSLVISALFAGKCVMLQRNSLHFVCKGLSKLQETSIKQSINLRFLHGLCCTSQKSLCINRINNKVKPKKQKDAAVTYQSWALLW